MILAALFTSKRPRFLLPVKLTITALAPSIEVSINGELIAVLAASSTSVERPIPK